VTPLLSLVVSAESGPIARSVHLLVSETVEIELRGASGLSESVARALSTVLRGAGSVRSGLNASDLMELNVSVDSVVVSVAIVQADSVSTTGEIVKAVSEDLATPMAPRARARTFDLK